MPTNNVDYTNSDNFIKTNSSFSGSDCTVVIQLNNKLIVVGNLETFSHSIHREKSPVRVLGRSHCKGYTAGPRTIAGSMIFVVFDRAPLYDVIQEINYVRNTTDRFTSPLPDQLPPLDVILLFQNEYGHQSITKLFGVEFLDEGQVHSINDIYSECTMQYVAKDMDQMISYSDINEFKKMMFDRQSKGLFIDNQFQALLQYSANLKQRINDCDTKIKKLDNTESEDELVGNQGDIGSQIFEQNQLKGRLVKELRTVDDQISKKQKSITGWNAQNSDFGVTTSNYDYISHAPNTPR